jgi:hypothetical protein
VNGWASDPNDRTKDVPVRVLVDGKLRLALVANQYRADLPPVIGGDGTAGFWVDLSEILTPGIVHEIRVEAQDLETRQWALLNLSPRGMSCDVPGVSPSRPSGENSFAGNFDMLDQGTGLVVGHVVVNLKPETEPGRLPGTLDVTWTAASPQGVGAAHGEIYSVWFGDDGADPHFGVTWFARATGLLCDEGPGASSWCRNFAVDFLETVSPDFSNYVGWSLPDTADCCGGPWYAVGDGKFALTWAGQN